MGFLQKILGRDGTSQARVAKGGNVWVEPRTPGVGDAAFLGSYGFSVVTGTLAAALAANAVVFSARWGDATAIAAIVSLRTRFIPLTAFTAATLTDHTSFDAVKARSFSASHTGGTGLTLTGNSFKNRTSFASTAFTDLRIATTAALAGGTLTLDPHPFTQSIRKGNRVNPAAATEETIQPSADGLNIDFDASAGLHPIILTTNEGIIIRNRTVWPAAGTGVLLVELNWNEYATSADY
jgi:hypothetical protein